MNSSSLASQHLLVYEPRMEGHHPGWLRFITEDLLSAGFRLSLATDQRPAAQDTLRQSLGSLLDEVKIVPVYDDSGRRRGGKTGSVELCLRESGAGSVFLCAFDEIASAVERRAAFGILPPAPLRGRAGGIYHRPRFMAASRFSPNRWLKHLGFCRLARGGWFRQILFVDPYLARQWQEALPQSPLYFLPDPCPPDFSGDRAAACQVLGLPAKKRIFLFYGVGSRRKGLHLATAAMRLFPASDSAFLLCAGRFEPNPKVSRDLDLLALQGRARAINRYVSNAEEKLLFAASDFVLLPYVHHFGTSGVLSRAAAAGKPVIVSDEQLLGRLVRDNKLGLLFPSGDVPALCEQIRRAKAAFAGQLSEWAAAARNYAGRFSRAAHRAALLRSVIPNPVEATDGRPA
jgi:glycosyltransferase involved in cell wall biosynthesis